MKFSNALTVLTAMATSAIAVPVADASPAETQVEKRCLGGGYPECVAISGEACSLKCLSPKGQIACMIRCHIDASKNCQTSCS